MRLAVLAALVGFACGGTARSADTRQPVGGNNPDQVSEGGDTGQPVDPAAPPSAELCDRFTAHVLELYRVEQRAALDAEGKADLVPTDEQVAEIHEKMSGECLQFPRVVVECGIAAETFVAVAVCQNKAPGPGE